MGRNKKKNKHLPKRMYQKHGAYYYVAYVDGKKKWTRLDSEYPKALAKWAEIEGKNYDTQYFKSAVLKYELEELPFKAQSTQEVQALQLKKLNSAFGAMPLAEIRTVHIQQYLTARTAKVAANREISLMSTLFNKCKSWGWIDNNPCNGATKHKEKKRDRYITQDEFSLLKSHADETFKCLIDIAYLTAARISDIREIQLTDITDEFLFIKQNKTGNKQKFELTPDLLNVINRAKKARKTRNLVYLFTNTHGQPITKTGFNSAWRRLVKKAGIENIHFHDIRASAITDADEANGLDYAQSLGGHTNQSQTESYIKNKSTRKVTPLSLK